MVKLVQSIMRQNIQQKGTPATITTSAGIPVGKQTAVRTAGKYGPALLQDTVFLDNAATFNRERIPERVVHAKGAGAFGYFEVTHDITKYSAAKVFDKIGKQTKVAVRFSHVVPESGSPDTIRDIRGFALKFYTEDGNWDLVGNHSPVFFIRDAMLFGSVIHALKRNPVTHLRDPNMMWDFFTLRPESMHTILFMYSDRGIPADFRHMNGFGVNTFQLVNNEGTTFYTKFHYKTDQGIKNMPEEEAIRIAGTDPDYYIRDLYSAIAEGNYPTYSFYIQVMTVAQVKKAKFNPFDSTRIWPQDDFPLIPVGHIVFNENPRNYFIDIEQLAFAPANMVPGINPSPDKLLQGRLFAYSDAHRYRLGTNFLQIPVNCPIRSHVTNYQRDGKQNVGANQGGAPNYYPNSYNGPEESSRVEELQLNYPVSGNVGSYDNDDEDNFTQSRAFYKNVLTEDEKIRLINAVAKSLKQTAPFIQDRAISMFNQVDPELGSRISLGLLHEL